MLIIMSPYYPGKGKKGLGGKTVKIPEPLLDPITQLIEILRTLEYGDTYLEQNNAPTPHLDTNLVQYPVPAYLHPYIKEIVDTIENVR